MSVVVDGGRNMPVDGAQPKSRQHDSAIDTPIVVLTRRRLGLPLAA